MSSTDESTDEGTDKSPLSLGQVDGDRTGTEDSSAVSGNSLEKEDGLKTEDGSGISASSVSSPNSLPETEGIEGISEGDGAINDGAIIEGAIMLRGLCSDTLLQSSAVTYSVERSEGHISAVTYSVEHTSAVL